MPSRTKRVRFETEYNSSFKAFDPEIYTSPLISAFIDEPRSSELDKTKPPAGLKSNKFLKSVEPPLQRKSKAVSRQGNESKDKLSNEKQKLNTKYKLHSEERVKAKTNRALEYKAGLKSDNSLEKTKFPVSEYQREYEWKKFAISDSPLLNAEKIVFDSHTNIPRFVRDKVPRKTEYQSKFAETRRDSRKGKKEENKNEREESEDNPPSAVKRLLQTSHNPDLPFFPHGSTNRVIHTEYQANFASPKKYQYEEGIWLGAKPPHLLPDDQLTAESSERITNWFMEVLELREKARHYKTRAIEGNYFSREYLAQLDAELEQLYNEQSKNWRNGRSDAGSESRNKPGCPRNKDVAQQHSTGDLGRPPVRHAWGDEKSSETIEDGKRVYQDLNEKFKDVSLDSDISSSHSDSTREKDPKKYLTKQELKKTVNQKHLSQRNDGAQDKNNETKPLFNQKQRNETKAGHPIKRDMPLIHDESSHSERSGPVIKHPDTKNPPKTALNQKYLSGPHGIKKPPQTMRRHAPLLQDVSPSNSEDSRISSEPHTKTSETESLLDKILNRKPLPCHRNAKSTQTVKGGGPLLCNISSGSEASSELSEEPGAESEGSRYKNPDKFDIKYVQGLHSNEAPSTSVRSNYDSESLKRNGYDSDSYLSQSSLASRESVARETLAHAKKRKENFWK